MTRDAVPTRVQRAERMVKDARTTAHVAPLNAARTAQHHPYQKMTTWRAWVRLLAIKIKGRTERVPLVSEWKVRSIALQPISLPHRRGLLPNPG
jgi:hypothetical protein